MIVRVELPDCVSDVGLKLALVPEGSPLTPNTTLPVKPEFVATEILMLVLAPAFTVAEDGAAESAKGDTTSVTVFECANAPLVPNTVIG